MAGYVQIPNAIVDNNDRPRKFTNKEIQIILDHLPYPKSADGYSSDINREGAQNYVREILMDSLICPSGFYDLINRIMVQHVNSLIDPGTSAGMNAAEAIGSVITQMTLNTFHTAGSAVSASSNIDLMQDLLFARKTPKHPITTIYFKDKKISYKDALNSRQFITGVKFSELVKNYDIDYPKNLKNYWWSKKDVDPNVKILRLYINQNELFKYKINMQQLAKVFVREKPDKRFVTAVYSPISDGIIDLHPIIEKILVVENNKVTKSKFTKLTSSILNLPEDVKSGLIVSALESIVIPELDLIRIGGISEMGLVQPQVVQVMTAIVDERKNDINTWRVKCSDNIMDKHGITIERILKLMTLSNLKVSNVELPYIYVNSDVKPSEIISQHITAAKSVAILPEIVVESEIITLAVQGSNLQDILGLNFVDTERTYCNNLHVMNKVIGVEGALNFLSRTIAAAVKGSNVNPAHVLLISEFIMSKGEPSGANYVGITRQGTGQLSLATVERASEVFARHALFSREESTRNVSAAIVVGERASVGTGFSDVAQDIMIDGKLTTVMNDALYDMIDSKEKLEMNAGEKLQITDILDNLDFGEFETFDTNENSDEVPTEQLVIYEIPKSGRSGTLVDESELVEDPITSTALEI